MFHGKRHDQPAIAATAAVCPPVAVVGGTEILVISSYHPEYLWDQSYNASLAANLKGDHHISHFYMDTKRRPAEEFDQIAEQALAYYRQVKPDLVVLGDDNAINYLASDIASLGTLWCFSA